jgi:hypothetical protein
VQHRIPCLAVLMTGWLALGVACDSGTEAPRVEPETPDAPLGKPGILDAAPGASDAAIIDAVVGSPDAPIADARIADARLADAAVDARPPDVCGDLRCTGNETSNSCCTDCGCPSGYSCSGGVCSRVPYCGDGVCNGGENSSSCCTDCRCPGGYTCNGNACQCDGATVRFTNVLPDAHQYCPLTGTWYTQQSVAYMSIGGTTWYMPDGAWVSTDGALGSSYGYTTQCCYLDGCLGNLQCRTPSGTYPCLCAQPYVESGRFTCGLIDQAICE